MVILLVVILLTVDDVHQPEVHPPGPHQPLARPHRWRAASPGSCFAGWAAWVDFDRKAGAQWVLVLTSLYLCLAGIAQQIVPERAVIRRRP